MIFCVVGKKEMWDCPFCRHKYKMVWKLEKHVKERYEFDSQWSNRKRLSWKQRLYILDQLKIYAEVIRSCPQVDSVVLTRAVDKYVRYI